MKNKWHDEFEAFMSSNEESVPKTLFEEVRTKVAAQLTPNRWLVFTKLWIIHFFAGSATLVVCPQFGIEPFGGGQGLMHIVMEYGYIACALFCASVFFGATAIAAYALLSLDEKRILSQQRIWHFSGLAVLSVALFMGLQGLELSTAPSPAFSYTLTWIVSGALIGQIIFQSLYKLKLARIRVPYR